MRAPRQGGSQPLPWWSIGYLAPRLVALAVVVDITLRLVPVGWIGQDGYRLPYEAFARNHHFQGRGVGDISSIANLPQRGISRSESWTTDAIGFRNAGPMRDIAGIVLGDSFGDANLSALLGRSTGCRIYNAASHREEQELATPTPDRVVNLARYVGMDGGLVVFERVERLPPLRVPGPTAVRPDIGRRPSLFDRAWARAEVSPARRLGEAALKPLFDDRILPNVYRRLAVEKRLLNGDWMLFYRDEMKNYEAPRRVSIEYWTLLQAGLGPASLRLLIVLVPNKYTVYYRHLVDATPTSVAPEQYLTATESALRGAGISVVNLTEALQREATEALRRGEYLYHRDDTHWNEAGVATAAREVARVWTQSGGRQCP